MAWQEAADALGLRTVLESMVAQQRFPPTIFVGAPGTGKTTLIKRFVHAHIRQPFSLLWLTAADRMDVAFVRETVMAFLCTQSEPPRFLVVDEADCLPLDAQACLAQQMQQTHPHTTIWLISNFHSRLISDFKALTLFVPGRSPESMRQWCLEQHPSLPLEVLETAIAYFRGDHRAMKQWLQHPTLDQLPITQRDRWASEQLTRWKAATTAEEWWACLEQTKQ